jgi:imidazolonepropionase-like amidohydrolase
MWGPRKAATIGDRLAALCLLLAACAPAHADLVIRGVTVVDVTDGSLRSGQTVLVEDDRIVSVGATDAISVPDDIEVVEAVGEYLIPGLWDMHVHAIQPGWTEPLFKLFIANGVTGVREMTGDSGEARRIEREIDQGRSIGPRFTLPGNLVDGPNSIWPFAIVVTTAEEGRATVDRLASEGAAFIKVYSYLTPEAYSAIAERANEKDIPFVGHVPYLVPAGVASDAGQRSFEHLIGIAPACSNAEEQLLEIGREQARARVDGDEEAERELESRWLQLVLSTQDEKRCAQLFEKLAANETWQVPTLALHRGLSFMVDGQDSLDQDPRLKYVPREHREWWEEATKTYLLDPAFRRMYELRKTFIPRMAAAGVPIMAGTDTTNPYCLPGFGLHDELELLVSAGLTPLQALQAATIQPARFLGKADSLGSVEAGKLADLVLLEGNPLVNISNTKRIRAVVANGRLFRRADLDRLLAEAEGMAHD